MAAAIGNSYQINIRNEWKDSPSLYMMLIGRPGLGKTPPLNFLYKPINDLDDRLDEKYSEELEKYERAKQANGGNDKLKAPKCAKGWRNQVKKTLKNVNVTPNNNIFLA